MVCGDGCILRTHRVLGKGVVYVIILGVRMVSFLCHGILLIHIWSCDMLYSVHMELVVFFEMVRSSCHVYVSEAMVGTLRMILV